MTAAYLLPIAHLQSVALTHSPIIEASTIQHYQPVKLYYVDMAALSVSFDSVFERVPVKLAQRGDIVVFSGEQGQTAGVIWGGQIWSTGEYGAGPTQVIAEMAWRVHG